MRLIGALVAVSLSTVALLHADSLRPKQELAAGVSAAESYNWTAAVPHLRYAELHLPESNQPERILAKVLFMRSTMEQRNLTELTRAYGALENSRVVQANPELRMWLYIAKGDCDNDLQFPEAAKRDWQKVQQLASASKSQRWIYRAKGELAIPAYYMGDLATSRTLVTEALESAKAAKDDASVVRLLTHIGTVYMLRGDFASGLEHLTEADQIAATVPAIGYPVTVKEGELLGLIGTAKLSEAAILANDIIKKMHAQDRRINEAQTRVMVASICQKQKNFPAAIRELTTAIEMSRRGNYYHSLSDAQMALAEIYLQMGQLSRASALVAGSVISTEKTGIVSDVPMQLRLLANLRAKQAQYADADALYKRAEDVIDSELALTPMSSKQLLLKSTSDIYTDHFELSAEHLHDVNRDYAIVERVRGRMLADLLNTGSRSKILEDDSAEQEVSALRLKLASARTAAEAAQARDDIFFARHKRWLMGETGSPGSLRRNTDAVLPLITVQKNLRPSELLIEYVVTSRSIYALVITDQSARVAKLGSAEEINKAVARFVGAVHAKQTALEEGASLYTALFKPVPEIADHSSLILVPDGQLHGVPFAALVANGKRLVEMHSLIRTPSASTWVLLRQRDSSSAKEGLLAVGGVRYNADVSRIARVRGYGEQLSNLPGSQEEAETASEILGPSLRDSLKLEDEAATETAVKSALKQQREVVHLAVHGFSHSKDDPELAALVFLADRKAGEDGILEVREIVRLHLHSDLVVLSACETAVGELEGEEGVSNLSRSFLLSGAGSVTSTLWSVDDVFSATLMKHFYAALVQGDSKAEALEDAQRYVLKQFSGTAVPWYWAGYVMEGDATGPLPSFERRASARLGK